MIISLSTKSILRFQYEAAKASRFINNPLYKTESPSNIFLTSNAFSYVKIKDLNEIKEKHK